MYYRYKDTLSDMGSKPVAAFPGLKDNRLVQTCMTFLLIFFIYIIA